MGDTAILFPVFALILLTFIVQTRMGFCRVRAASRGRVELKDIALNSQAWPDDVIKVGNNFNNLLQVPVLFYVLAAFLLITRSVDYLQIVLAWVFVASRVVHTLIHIGANNVLHRLFAYAFGNVVVIVMWVYFAFHIISRS